MTDPAPDPRAAGWAEGYAQGLVDGLQTPGTITVDLTRLCTCGVVSGGIRDPHRTCEVHHGQ